MKKFFSITLSVLFALVAGMTFSFVFENASSLSAAEAVNNVSSANQLVELANKVNAGTYNEGNVVLTQDIDFSELGNNLFVPIGTQDHPFTWKFDGKGHRINNFALNFTASSSVYQGLFGVTENATIQNLQINGFKCGEWTQQNDAYIGALVGKAIDTTITNCEFDNILDQPSELAVSHKVTFGGMAGWITGNNSKIENICSYYDYSVSYALVNAYTIKFGGIAGIIEDCEIKKVVSMSNIDIKKQADVSEEEVAEAKLFVGGIAAEVPTNLAKIKDCVSAGKITYQSDISDILAGKIAGRINEHSANIASVAYTVEEGESVTSAYGSQLEEKNNVMRVPSNLVRVKSFYEQPSSSFNDGGVKIFNWSPDEKEWDFDNVWILVLMGSTDPQSTQVTEMRLQLFQNFEIGMRNPIDSGRLLSLVGEEEPPESGTRKSYKYNEIASFKFHFTDEADVKFYQISEIYCGRTPLGYADFKTTGENEKQSLTNDIIFSTSTEEGSTVYTLQIYASNLRAGDYYIELSNIEYNVYVVAGENGNVRYRNESDLVKEKLRTLHKTQSIYPEAKGENQYTFSSWSLYYQDPEGDFEYADKKWKKQDAFETEENHYTDNFFTLQFGSGMFDRECILLANFVHDPLVITLNFDYDMVDKIEVNGSVITATGSSVLLGKDETARMKIYVKKTAEITPEDVVESIKKWFLRETSVVTVLDPVQDPTNSDLMVYEFSFSTSAIDYQTNGSELGLSIKGVTVEPEKKDNTIWIIVGVVGGVVVLAAIGLTIWLVLRRKYSGGGRANDYKKMYY